MRFLLVALLAAAPAALFEDIAAIAGLTHVIPNGGVESKKYIVETTGSGVALFDYDNDGLTDIFIVSGEGSPSRLYRNLGKLRFEEVGAKLGLTRQGWGQGACAADFDGDGFTDLLVTYWGGNSLYRNSGGRRFETVPLPASDSKYSTGCVFFDYDRDGDADLYISSYLKFGFDMTPPPGANPFCFYKGVAVSCGPRGLPFERNILYRNDGGRFVDVSEASGIAAPSRHYSLGAVATDVDNDGDPDLYVASDQTPSLLYINNGDGTLTEEGLIRGVALDENGKALSGMGVAAADYDNDGDFDLFRTNFSDERVTLYRNQGNGFFDEVTTQAGLGRNTRYVGWGTAFLDYDNDGRVDLLQVNGHVFPETGDYRQRPILYRNMGGRFEEVPAPGALHSARGLAVGDLDNDGTLEVVVNNQNAPPSLWKLKQPSGNNWIAVRAPLGTRVEVTAGGVKQTQEVRAGGSYLSQHEGRLHFGVGAAKVVERVRVVGERVLTDVAVGEAIKIP